MLKTTRVLFCFLLLATLANAQTSTAKWTITEGINTPESVYFDAASGSIFVSNVIGEPNAKDGKGTITKVTRGWKVGLARVGERS